MFAKFTVKEELTEEEVQSGLRTIIKDGITSQAMVTVTSGAFLVAFALKLGASNLVIGLLAAIPPLMQLLQIPAIYLVEKIRIRRAISVYSSVISRTLWLVIASIPFVLPPQAAIIVLIVALAVQSAFSAVSACSWNSWMRDIVPQDQMGLFYSKRMRLSITFGILLSIAGGVYIDVLKRQSPKIELYGYSLLFAIGFLVGMLGVYFMSKIPEPRMAEVKRINLLSLFQRPFKDDNYRRLILFLSSWNFSVNLAAPFFTVYMLKTLNMSMAFIISLTVLSQIMNVLFLRICGKCSDRFSNKSVLGVCGPLFMACIIGWTFTTLPEKYAGTIPLLILLHLFMGISLAGVALSTGNIALKLAPKEDATAYLATNSLVTSLAAAAGPILGGIFADFFANRQLSMTVNWSSPAKEVSYTALNFQHWDFFFALAFLIGLYSLHRLTRVREIGEVEEEIVIQEIISQFRRPMRSISSVEGLWQLVSFPFSRLMQITKINNKTES